MKKIKIEIRLLDISDKIGSLYNDLHSEKKSETEVKDSLVKISDELNAFIAEF
jgi:hypothetical protein